MNIILEAFSFLFEKISLFTGDWGLAIILLTVTIRTILLPFSIKQKQAITNQQAFSKKISEIKEQYKNSKSRLEAELAKQYKDGSKNFLGCFVTLLQLPVVFALYNTISNMPMSVGTMIVPWVSSLKLADPFFVIPAISIIIQLLPNIMASFGIIKSAYIQKATVMQVVIICIINLMFLAKAPISIGIYWVTTSFYSVIEQIGYGLFMRNRKAASEA
ncbi:MAG: membrane protein insertase YidC [Clostridia bacterium]|nr:membrane protein insertase YidC [Clostridia bacterium]